MFGSQLSGHVLQARARVNDNGSVVFWTDIFLVSILGIFILAAFPRTLGRLVRRSGWRKGHLLYHIPNQDDTRSTDSDESMVKPYEKYGSYGTIFHVRSLTTHFHGLGCILRHPILSHVTIGRFALYIFYFSTLLFAALFRDSVFKNPMRAGALAASQIPWVYILATKNSFIGTLMGVGYEKLNYLHRFAGRLLVLAGNVHAIGYMYKWVIQGVWTQRTQETYVRWGLVGLVSLDILFIFSLKAFRKEFYNLFLFTHLIALVVFMVAVCLHMSFAIPYVAIAAGFYGADRLLRVVKSRVAVAYLQTIPDLGTTLIRIPALNTGWRAGQHVRIRVLSRHMGIFGWAEVHPYSIANACEGVGSGLGSDGLVIMAKKAGGWSRHLYELADYHGETSEIGGPRVRVIVEGPYGGPGNTMFSTFSGALFVTGGSGISFALAGVQELLQQASEGTCNVKSIGLFWSVHHARSLWPLMSLLETILQQSYTTPVSLKIEVRYTRETMYHDEEKVPHALPAGMKLASGRAWIPLVISEFIDNTTAVIARSAGGERGNGIIVAACGPTSLVHDVRRSFARIDKNTRQVVGGVELHEEAFHW